MKNKYYWYNRGNNGFFYFRINRQNKEKVINKIQTRRKPKTERSQTL